MIVIVMIISPMSFDDVIYNINDKAIDFDDNNNDNWLENQVGVLISFSSLDTFAAILTRFS